MHYSVRSKNVAVTLEEQRRGETLGVFFHLRIRECEPYFTHLTGSEEVVDNLDVRAQKAYIRKTLAQSLSGTCPHARTLNIHSYEVHIRIATRKTHSVFATAATKLNNYGIIVLEKLFAPISAHGEGGSIGY